MVVNRFTYGDTTIAIKGVGLQNEHRDHFRATLAVTQDFNLLLLHPNDHYIKLLLAISNGCRGPKYSNSDLHEVFKVIK
jgi:hypothetical protein